MLFQGLGKGDQHPDAGTSGPVYPVGKESRRLLFGTLEPQLTEIFFQVVGGGQRVPLSTFLPASCASRCSSRRKVESLSLNSLMR
jgi:hypothetical protein